MTDTTTGDGWAVGSLDGMGEGPGFRKVRKELGVTAFGVNAIVLPPGYASGRHLHERQQELYFVLSGTIEFTFGDDEKQVARAGRLRARRPRHGALVAQRRPSPRTRSTSASAARAATSAATACCRRASEPALDARLPAREQVADLGQQQRLVGRRRRVLRVAPRRFGERLHRHDDEEVDRGGDDQELDQRVDASSRRRSSSR